MSLVQRLANLQLCLFLSMGLSTAAHTTESSKPRWDMARSLVMDEIKQEYEEGKDDFKPGATEVQKNEWRYAYKFLLYNKAYGLTKCLAENSSTPDKLLACREDFMAELRRYTGLFEYAGAVGPRRLAQCLMRTRLFNEEFKFPPYDFLKTDGTETHKLELYDLKKFNDCQVAP